MDVSIIIVNYNTAALACAAIESVHRLTTGIAYEIIVVDNASSDGTQIRDRFGDAIRYLPLPENIGFGRANNAAIEQAKGRHLFLLNPDTILLNDAAGILSRYLDQVCGGNLYDADRRPTHSFLRALPGLGIELDTLFFGIPFRLKYGRNRFFNFTGRPMKVGYITGADMMIRADVLRQTGVFDPDFFMYFEETELTHRIKAAGYDVMSVPEAEIIHLEGKSFSLRTDRMRRFFESKLLYLNKTQSLVRKKRILRVSLLYSRIRRAMFCWHPARRNYWRAQIALIKPQV